MRYLESSNLREYFINKEHAVKLKCELKLIAMRGLRFSLNI